MIRDDILRMAREAGFITGTRDYADGNSAMPFVQSVATGTFLPELERFHALATERERAARQAAQTENEDLKARLARAGVEQRRAVWKEREACAKACEAKAIDYQERAAKPEVQRDITPGVARIAFLTCGQNAAAIRSRKDHDEPDLRPNSANAAISPSVAPADQQTPTQLAPAVTITCVAIRYNGNVYTMPAPHRHADVIRMIGGIAGPDTQGFLDSDGNFLTRTEAMKIAVAAGQLKRGPGGYQGPELFSEDLW